VTASEDLAVAAQRELEIRRIAYYEDAIHKGFGERVGTLVMLLFVRHPAINSVQHFKEEVTHAIAARDAALEWVRNGMEPVISPTELETGDQTGAPNAAT
jgi:hypothetical protein